MSYGICTWQSGDLHVVAVAHDKAIAEATRDDLAANGHIGSPLFVAPITQQPADQPS